MRLRLISALALLLMGVGATAMPTLARADESLTRAREHFDKASGLYSSGKYADAAAEFNLAYDERPFAKFLFNIGACHEKLRDYDKAVEFYKRYAAAETDAKEKADVAKRITVLEKEAKRIAEIKAKAGTTPDGTNPDGTTPDGTTPDGTATQPSNTDTDTDTDTDTGNTGNQPKEVQPSEAVKALGEVKISGLVVIESEPPGALVYLDSKKSKPLSKTPWNGTLVGEHTIFIEKQGYKPVERRFAPDPNTVFTLIFSLSEQDYLGWVEIKSNVPGADIYVDDKSVGVFAKTPYSGNIKPGKHKIWVTTEGYDEHVEEIEIIAGETHTVTAKLDGTPVGYINVRGPGVDRMTIYVDGKVLCERGPCRKAVKRGKHQVSVRRSGYKSYTRNLDIQAKTEVILRANLVKKPGRADAVWAYVFTGAFLGGGIYLGSRSDSLLSELEDEIRKSDNMTLPPDSEDPRFQRGKLYAIGADAAYVLTGITALTAIYYTFRDKGRPSSGSIDVRAVAITPQVTPTYAGLGLELNW